MKTKYQKRHYIDIAKLLGEMIKKGILEGPSKIWIVSSFVTLFEEDNPLFKKEVFMEEVEKYANQ